MNKKLRILAVSDTHENTRILHKIAENYQGDIFIHAGDFTYYGEQKCFIEFCEILDKLKFRHKIVISGNHEISLDCGCIQPQHKKQYLTFHPCRYTRQELVNMLKKRCHYLEHEAIEIEGVKIFGSPYTTMYCGSAFQYQLKYEQDIWDHIPKQVDLLITHMPPFGILDENTKKIKAGSKILRDIVIDRKPKIHIFGHIHQGRGNLKFNEIVFLNVACNPLQIMFEVHKKQN